MTTTPSLYGSEQTRFARYLEHRETRSPDPVARELRCRLLAGIRGRVLDLGCGHGVPISQTLIQHGCAVYGVDASPRLVAAFREKFPDVPVVCEAIKDSSFFDRLFDGAVAWGVMFLLPIDVQARVIASVSRALNTGRSMPSSVTV